jgi:non-ribosomal peptide synthetase-like protein
MLVCKDADNTVRWKHGERLNHYFEQRCDQLSADHLAVIAEDATLTFRQLDDRANQAARYLLDQGLKPGDRIALLFDKSIHSYVALLAVLKMGAAYVPLDAGFPNDRIAFILEDAEVKAILSVSSYREKLAEFQAKQIFLDQASADVAAKSTARLTAAEAPHSDDQLFYIIYTSGTTGKPKGVAIDHAGICNFVKVAGEVYGIRDDDRCYQGMTLAFDFHVESLWVPLIAGATLIGGKSGSNLFGADLHAFLKEHRVTVFPCVPTLWATVEQDLPDVRIVLLSGESVPHHLVVRWHKPGRSILNAYGPTECSVSSTIRFLVPDRPVTIGIPLPTYTVVILDENKDALVPDGATGEIGIAGVALARGYVNREELTRQKFVPDFLNIPNNTSGRIYRTGDLGSIREDGELEFSGRIDTQVKIRGYRIELGEIEAVLMQVPQIAQVVVNPYEPEPGAVELVAYYTRKQDAGDISASEVSETLRKQLPSYMVPGYLEELAVIPMTPNNKADRKNLPAPKGTRLSASTGKFVAPRTETEQGLLGALIEVMKIERASVEDHFFQDLGAHSLLMARFGAEIRKRMQISSVSMQDIYQNPTIEKLARHLDALPKEPEDDTPRISNRDSFYFPSDASFYLCGALQAAWLIAGGGVAAYIAVWGIQWTYAAMPDFGETYLRIVAFSLGSLVFFTLLPIAAKWLIIGRWKVEAIPVWSLRYFRFWVMKTLIRSAPMAQFGGPIYNLYLRLLGAKIGKNATVFAKYMPICTDLISIGDNTMVRKDSVINGYKAQSNYILTGPIEIGANSFVGEGGIVDINTVMEDNTQLGHASSLHEGQRVPRGKRFHGCPAVETTADYCAVAPMECTPLRRWTYSLVQIVAGFALAPIPMLVIYWIFPTLYMLFDGPAFVDDMTDAELGMLLLKWAPISLALFFGGTLFGLIYIGVAPRLLNRFLERDRTYVLYGFHYYIHQLIVRTSNSRFFNNVFGDSSYIVHYMTYIGWNLNTIIQTGSNFGSDQRHDNPFLCDIGTGTMVSGGLKMINETMSSSSFKLGQVKVGDYNYLGNYIRIPSESKVGENVLIGTKMLVPIDGPIRENVGLLGSPCFEIPRAVSRDLQMSKMDEETTQRQLRKKLRYNIGSSTLFLLNNWFLSFMTTFFGVVALLNFQKYGMAALFAVAPIALAVSVLWMYFVERLSLKFGMLEPRICRVLDEYYWFHERHKLVSLLHVMEGAFAGTPFKNIVSRLQGIRVGKRVFDDGFQCNEYTLISIGDYTNLNVEGLIQPHTLEEAVFKSDYVKIGKGCTLGVACNIHYGVTFGDFVVLEPNTFVMKGEIADADTTWRGNPARAVGGGVVRRLEQKTPAEAFVPAKVA